jgi:hypothetical protein
MSVDVNRQAIAGAVLAAGAGLSTPSLAAIPSPRDGRVAAIAKRIAALVLEREANDQALEAAAARFDLPPTPPELMVTYRGPLDPLKIEVEPDCIRDVLADVSPRSRRGRRLRKLLRLHDAHYSALWAARAASGIGPLIDERERIKQELNASAEEIYDLEGHDAAHLALQAAMLLVAGDGVRDVPAALLVLLEAAGAA